MYYYMKKIIGTIALIVCFINVYGQEKNKKGPHGGSIVSLGEFNMEMVREGFSCLSHPEIKSIKKDVCSKCDKSLEKDKKIEFYLLDNNYKELDISNLEGKVRVRIVFKDETAVSKKAKLTDKSFWIPLRKNGLSNFQQAIVRINYKSKKYIATYGDPIVHHGGHHH